MIDTLPTPPKKKNILVLSYSQTGQLAALVQRIVEPLIQSRSFNVHVESLRPVNPFPFPWTFFSFFDAFPESSHLIAPELQPLSLSGDEDFDLVIVPYQVWFLAPSQPIAAFLKNPIAAQLLRGKPVVTVIACRNMWVMAQEKMKSLLTNCQARLKDNVVLVDPSSTIATLVTTPAWLLSGKRDFMPWLPAAGLSEKDIQSARRFGLALRDALNNDQEIDDAPMLAGLSAVNSDPRLLISEKAGTRSFHIWGKLLLSIGKPGQMRRRPFLALYVVFLVTMILTIVPVSLLVQTLARPLLRHRMGKLKQQFDAPSGSGTERLHRYLR